jgi:hypothetical protein
LIIIDLVDIILVGFVDWRTEIVLREREMKQLLLKDTNSLCR